MGDCSLTDGPDPIVFMTMTTVITSDCLYHDFIFLIFLHTHRETDALVRKIPEESDQFCFLQGVCLTNLKGSVGLILVKTSVLFSPTFRGGKGGNNAASWNSVYSSTRLGHRDEG